MMRPPQESDLTTSAALKYRAYSLNDLPSLASRGSLDPEHLEAMNVVAQVLPFRVNNYVVEQLIDWSRVPEDPIFQLVFPQPGMLAPDQFERVRAAREANAGPEQLRKVVDAIRWELNPHPSGQLSDNVPLFQGEPVSGVQRKYLKTCLVFPAAGQTCHAYCSFCFRWPQFVGMQDLKFATDPSMRYLDFVRHDTQISDVLFTGGDPMVMNASVMARYLEPLLGPGFEHVRNIRIGSKCLAYWPYRFVTDPDADDLLRLFERVAKAGKHLAFMAHFSHWRELSTDVVRTAIQRVRSAGAEIRTQSPLLRHINDDADVWARMWSEQVHQGCVPYYMFIERDTGANCYFKVPIAEAVTIFTDAVKFTSGLARTARGPMMSAFPGKVIVHGVAELQGEKVFVLSMMQARHPDRIKKPFFAKFDPQACWLSELRPAFEDRFFWESELPPDDADVLDRVADSC